MTTKKEKYFTLPFRLGMGCCRKIFRQHPQGKAQNVQLEMAGEKRRQRHPTNQKSK
jgi:hypothetical protein